MTIKYDVTGFYNFREGGGMRTSDGRVVTEHLLRCDYPSGLDSDAIGFLSDIPVAGVIELRSEHEIKATTRFFSDAGLKVLATPINAASIRSMITDTPSVEQMYQMLIEKEPKQIAAAVGNVADVVPDGAALVHCTAGKDRTGIVIALIQEVIGVSDEDIVANYVLTEENLKGQWLQDKLDQALPLLAQLPPGVTVDLDKLQSIMSDSPATAIQGVLQTLREQYGSVEQFLLANGVASSQLDSLRTHLVQR